MTIEDAAMNAAKEILLLGVEQSPDHFVFEAAAIIVNSMIEREHSLWNQPSEKPKAHCLVMIEHEPVGSAVTSAGRMKEDTPTWPTGVVRWKYLE